MIASSIDNIPNAHLVIRLAMLSLAISAAAVVSAPLLFRRLARFRSIAHSLAIGALVLTPLLALSSHVGGIDWTRLARVKTAQPSTLVSDTAASPEPMAGGTSAADGSVTTVLWNGEPLLPVGLLSGGHATWINLLGLIWLAGFGVMLARLGAGAWWVAKVLRGTREPNAFERAKLAQSESPRDSEVPVRISPLPVVPFFSGFPRRCIVIPEKLVSQLYTAELGMVIEHEQAHCRQRDHWVALLQQLARAIHWWNPLVAVVNRRLSQTREELCDHAVTQAKPAEFVESYSRLLVSITDAFRPAPAQACALAVTSTYRNLRRRILMLKRGGEGHHRRPPRSLVAAVFLLTGLLLIPVSCRSGDERDEEEQAGSREALNVKLSELTRTWQKADPPAPPANLNKGEATTQIRVTSKFVEISEKIEDGLSTATVLTDPQFQELVRFLGGLEGTDLLSAPSILTMNGRQAKIEVVREVAVPATEGEEDRVGAGISLDITPTYSEGKIHLVGKATIRETDAPTEGAEAAPGGAVSFHTAESYFGASLENGKTLLLSLRKNSGDPGLLFIAITATVAEEG